MAKRDILKEAIADAKAVKEVAIANAKAALEEAFTPKLKSMLAAKIQEMDEDEESEDMRHKDDKGPDRGAERKSLDSEPRYNKKKDLDEDVDLDEILAELERDTLNEEEEVETEEEVEVEDDTEVEVETETEEEGVDIEDMTDEDLKTFIEDVIGDMVAAGELEAGEGFENGEDIDFDDDEELDIEIEDDETDEVEITERKSRFNSKFNSKLNENLRKEKRANIKAITENKKLRRELREVYAAIKTQKSTLNEVRLLNAKLLYTNKIFKAKSLNENEKIKVLSSFDKATTIKETKLIFETLSEGLNSKRKPIRESLGSASKATGNFKSTKKPIIKTDPMVARFQKLAGLK